MRFALGRWLFRRGSRFIVARWFSQPPIPTSIASSAAIRESPCSTSAVLFLDLLGTGASRSESEAQAHLLVTHRALEEARHYGGSERWDQHMSVSDWFSDNLGLAFPMQSGLDLVSIVGLTANAAADHQLSLALNGMFARGAIAYGSFYADADFIAGPALNRAVEREKLAVWPRVTLDEDSVALAREGLVKQEGAGSWATWRRALMVDEQGEVFVSYLDSMNSWLRKLTTRAQGTKASSRCGTRKLKRSSPARDPRQVPRAGYLSRRFPRGLLAGVRR